MTPEQQMNVRYQIFETLVSSGLPGLDNTNLVSTLVELEGLLTKEMAEAGSNSRQPSLNLVN